MTQPAPEVPGLSPRALSSLGSRPGFAIFLPGECLKADSKLWNEAQRQSGVFVKGVFLSASEEEEAITEAAREGKAPAAPVYSIRKSLSAISEPMQVEEEEGTKLAPGAWRVIPALERRAYWDELGPMGRALFVQAYQLANSPSQAVLEVALKSFRVLA